MCNDKIEIASTTNKGEQYWAPLMPIVEFCLERGCKLKSGKPDAPFYQDRNGLASCIIIGPITIEYILSNFELPDHFKAGWPYDNTLSDTKHRTEISFTSVEKHEAAEKRAADRKAERDQLRTQIQKKKAAIKNGGSDDVGAN